MALFARYEVHTHDKESKPMQAIGLSLAKQVLYVLADVVHALQEERGYSAAWIYSEGALLSERRVEQYRLADKQIEALQAQIAVWGEDVAFRELHYSRLFELVGLCSQLPEWRKRLAAGEVSAGGCLEHYSHNLIAPLTQQMSEVVLYQPQSNPAYASAYHAYLQWKERIGLERAIGMRWFVGEALSNEAGENEASMDEFIERVSFLLSEQHNYKRIYLALANAEQKRLVLQALENCAACGEIHRLHCALSPHADKSLLHELQPEAWFDLLSAKMDVLHAAEKDLVDSLFVSAGIARFSIHSGDSIDSNENLDGSEVKTSREGEHGEVIESLQLFSHLSSENLRVLLQNGQLQNYKKGRLLFQQGEVAEKLYIVVKGWIKIFKAEEDGEQAILQMFSAGETVMESAVFLNTPYPVSAQVVEDAVLLSVPADIFRQQIKSDSELAANLLTILAHRSQSLIRQIEDARLKSVDERIGWFLLKLLLEQGGISRQVKLPYEKSLIASYLNMKRETLSRALQRMQKQGFKIENNIVVIPNLASLCDFCNEETAKNCTLPNRQCQNPPEPHDPESSHQKPSL